MNWIRPFLPFITRTHRWVFTRSGGRIGARLPGLHFLLLEHVGRKSGLTRTTPLLCVPDGESFAVVASNAGQDHPPAWWLNLQARPEAHVRAGRRGVAVCARVASAEEDARLWPELNATYPWFQNYRDGTNRTIPVILLEPIEASDSGRDAVGTRR